jgi:hypothetical protein
MPDQSANVIAILGLYLALISILGSLFYIHLGGWFRQILLTEMKWTQFKNQKDDRGRQIECYLESFDEKGATPAVGFALLSIFMLVLGGFTLGLINMLPQGSELGYFLYAPGIAFFVLYCSVSAIYLVVGYRKVIRLFSDIQQVLSP